AVPASSAEIAEPPPPPAPPPEPPDWVAPATPAAPTTTLIVAVPDGSVASPVTTSASPPFPGPPANLPPPPPPPVTTTSTMPAPAGTVTCSLPATVHVTTSVNVGDESVHVVVANAAGADTRANAPLTSTMLIRADSRRGQLGDRDSAVWLSAGFIRLVGIIKVSFVV